MRAGSMSICTALALSGFGIELDVGEGGADDQQGVALLHRLLRRAGSQQADAARRVRAVIRHDGLAEQRLDDGRAEFFRQLFQFVARVQRALPGQNDDLFARVDDLGGDFQRLLRQAEWRCGRRPRTRGADGWTWSAYRL